MPRRKEKRPHFKSKEITILDCTPGNFDGEHGEDCTIITIGDKNSIDNLVLTLDDTRKLAAKLLISLYTAHDDFAEKILEGFFPTDEEGYFHWPRD